MERPIAEKATVLSNQVGSIMEHLGRLEGRVTGSERRIKELTD